MALLFTACTQADTDGVEHAGGALHKVRAPAKPSAAVRPATRPADAKNLDRAFDIEESKPADTKTLDRAFDIEESKPADTKHLDRAFDIEESKPLELDRMKTRPKGATPGAEPMPSKTPTR